MRKILCSLLLSFFSFTFLMAQGGFSVNGKVIEKDTQEPVLQATVQLLTQDSTYVTGIASQQDGSFSVPNVKAGNYIMKVSFIGYRNYFQNINVNKTQNVGTISLESDAILLKEAVVTAEAPQVQILEDTLVFNTSAYRVSEGAMLQELVAKLPGAKVDDNGNITINGKSISKIMVNGKEFFGGDVTTGIQNLPVEMVDKIKTYDRQSDMARATGIDDGDEETVLDLTVKKGMDQGFFGNADIAGGTHDRYSGRLMLNRFGTGNQLSFIGSMDNVNGQSFSGGGGGFGGGGRMGGMGNGLTKTRTAGLNYAMENDHLEFGISGRYNYRNNNILSVGSQENFITGGNSFLNSNTQNINRNHSFNADARLEWKITDQFSLLMRPNVSVGDGSTFSDSKSGTFDDDPFAVVDNPNEYLNIPQEPDPLHDIRVNTSSNGSRGDNNSLSAGTTLQLNQRFNKPGRNLTFQGNFNYNDNKSDSYTQALTDFPRIQTKTGGDSILVRNQFIKSPTKTFSYGAQVSYSEPIASGTYLQFSYQFSYRLNKNDRKTFDLNSYEWNLEQDAPSGYEAHIVDSLGKYAEYRTYSHDAQVGLRINKEKYQLNFSLSMQPQHTKLSYKKGNYNVDTVRNVFNFAPNVDLRWRFSKVSQLRFNYRGRSSLPNMENMLPIVDNSNPMNIRVGNPGLKPSFSHSFSLFFNDYNGEAQRGVTFNTRFNLTDNAVSNSRTYDKNTGAWTQMPKNINGNWNGSANVGFNTAFKDQRFTIQTNTMFSYNSNNEYKTDMMTLVERKNTTTNMMIGQDLTGRFRNDWFEFGVNGSINYNEERDKLTPSNNQKPYMFSFGANTSISFPWNMMLTSNITDQNRRGYRDASMNRSEIIWNAQLSQSMLKGKLSITFEMYDILHQQKNIMRSLTASGRSVYTYNGINSYCMLHLIYRLNVFGSRSARQDMRNARGGMPGGGRPEGMGPGGPGGMPGGGRPGGF